MPPRSNLLFAQIRCRSQTRCRGTCDREGGRCGGEPADASRRKFLSLVGVMACATVRAQEKKVDGGLAVIEQKKIPRRTTPHYPARIARRA